MRAAFRRTPAAPTEPLDRPPAIAVDRLVNAFGQRASDLSREVAEVLGALDDTQKIASAQTVAAQALAKGSHEVLRAQAAIADEVSLGLKAVAQVGDAVQGVAAEVSVIVDTLEEV